MAPHGIEYGTRDPRPSLRVHIPYTGRVPHLGCVVLASVLLGVPRALDARAFGARRPMYVEFSPGSPGLLGFCEALFRALGEACRSLAPIRSAATTVIDVLGVTPGLDSRGRGVEAVTLTVAQGGRLRRIVLHAAAGRREEAARELLARLSPGDC